LGALARGGAAPHNPGGNPGKLSRPQAVHAGPAGAVLCGLSCWPARLLGWLPSPVPAPCVLRLSTPALGLLAYTGGSSSEPKAIWGLAPGFVELG